MTFKEVLEYKPTKKVESITDKWEKEDLQSVKKEIESFRENKKYHAIQNEWKNNLIRKQKRHQRRVENQQNLPPVQVDLPKLVMHRFVIYSLLNSI